MQESVLNHALLYARLGLHVLPLHFPTFSQEKVCCSCGKPFCASKGKHPYPKFAPNGLKNANNAPLLLERWFKDTVLNVGIATGAISGIIAIDIDPRHNGDESLAALEKEHGPLPLTWRFLTGGGGEHILFLHPGGVIPNSTSHIGQGIDVRGDGGYIVAPPSKHESGRSYAISVDHDPEAVPLADVPDWLLSMIRAAPAPNEAAKAAAPEETRKRFQCTIAEGGRNDMIARLAGHLLRRRIDPWITLELLASWNATHCLPPLQNEEVKNIVNSIADCEIKRREGRHAASRQ
jgi:putative DNA primase/helicase